jgi:squalene synthase HpnC
MSVREAEVRDRRPPARPPTPSRDDRPEAAVTRAAMRGENFPVAPRVLPARLRRELVAAYRYARYVDDIGDEAPGNRALLLDGVAAQVRSLYAGHGASDPVVAGLAPFVSRVPVPIDPWLRLVEANRVDQTVVRYESFDSLLGYCRLSAEPVGEIVLSLFRCATPERLVLSGRICSALQLLEHWQDVVEDRAAGRIYLPQEDLRYFGVAESDLDAPAASPELRALLAFETDRALAWLDAGAPLVSTLHGWCRVAVAGYVAGGRAAAALLRRSGHDPTRVRKPRGWDIAAAAGTALVRWPG